MKPIILIRLIWLLEALNLSAQWTVNLGPMHVHWDMQWQNDRILVSRGSNFYEFDPNEGFSTGIIDPQI